MSITTNLALNEPAYNSTSPTWDQPLNYNATILDQMFGNTTGVSVNTGVTPTYTNITAPSATAAGSTSQAMRFNLTGALAANQTVLLPQYVAGMWIFSNNTTGAYTVTIGSNNGSNAVAGATITVQQGYSTLVFSDGTNVALANNFLIPVASGGTGVSSLTSGNVLIGNGTGAVQFVAPGTNGNVLSSNGSAWVSTSLSSSGRLVKAPQILTSGSGTYTVSASTNNIYIELIGGGGGSGGGASSPGNYGSNGGGGGGGAYAAKYFTVTPSGGYSYAVGGGGGGGTGGSSSAGGQGSSGGSTTFTVGGTTVTAGGGGGGFGGGANSTNGAGGVGGTATNGDLNITGNTTQGSYAGGFGGSSPGAAGPIGAYGAGGPPNNTSPGASGYGGFIRIWEYT